MNTIVPAEPTASGGGLPGAIASEWTKLWSVRSTWWMLLATTVLTILVCTQLALGVVNASTDNDPSTVGGATVLSEPAVGSIILVQYVVVAFAMLMVTSEYSTGSITATLQWVPRRVDVMLAKLAVLAPVAFGSGCLLSIAGAAAAAPWLGRWGEFDAPVIAADAVRTGTYLMLVCVLTLGVSAVLRSAVGSLTAVFLTLGVLPGLVGGSMLLPAGAGQSFLTATSDPWSPAVGLVVLAAWSAAAFAAGTWALRVRDA